MLVGACRRPFDVPHSSRLSQPCPGQHAVGRTGSIGVSRPMLTFGRTRTSRCSNDAHHIQELLGHANLSQTSTYLHTSEFGLMESMQKFDAARSLGGKPVANEAPTDQPLLGHGDPETTD